jgi:hypothetical protein
LAQAIGQAVIQQGYRVFYRETHALLEEIADATLDGTRKECLESLTTVPLLIIDDFGMRKLPLTAAEELLELIMRRYERASTLVTSNRPVEDWGKLLGDAAAVSAMLDRLLHHGHLLKCGPRKLANENGLAMDWRIQRRSKPSGYGSRKTIVTMHGYCSNSWRKTDFPKCGYRVWRIGICGSYSGIGTDWCRCARAS